MGMKRDGKVGNLVVIFDIVFPETFVRGRTHGTVSSAYCNLIDIKQ